MIILGEIQPIFQIQTDIRTLAKENFLNAIKIKKTINHPRNHMFEQYFSMLMIDYFEKSCFWLEILKQNATRPLQNIDSLNVSKTCDGDVIPSQTSNVA